MIIEVNMPVKLDIAAIKISVAVRYGEHDIPNDFPFRKDDLWEVIVDVDTGKIRDWPAGFTGECDMKITDQGSYWLLDKEGKVLAVREENYVPGCIPGEWGDYIRFDIDGDGAVKNWKKYWTAENIRVSFFSID